MRSHFTTMCVIDVCRKEYNRRVKEVMEASWLDDEDDEEDDEDGS